MYLKYPRHCERKRSNLILIFVCLFLLGNFSFSADPSWEEAVESLKSNKHEEASEKFAAWIKTSAEKKIYSPEAHYNLFLAQAALESSGPAVAHLLRSVQLEHNPLKNLDSIETLCELQNRYGIKEGLCQNKSFTLPLLFGNNSLLMFLCLFLWGLVFSCLFYFRKKTVLFKSILIGTILLGGTNLVSYFLVKSESKLMVLSTGEKNIPVYKSEGGKAEEKLVDFSSGTIVEVSTEFKNGNRHITQPISGWVAEDQLIRVDESLSQNPTFSIHSPKPD